MGNNMETKMNRKSFIAKLNQLKIQYRLCQTEISISYRCNSQRLASRAYVLGYASPGAVHHGFTMRKKAIVDAIEINGRIFPMKTFNSKTRTIKNVNFEKIIQTILGE